jgi:ribonuclease VapC
MILDTSSLVAIIAEEPDAELYIEAISRAQLCRISAGNFLELSIVIESQFGSDVLRQCDALFRRVGIVIEPVTVEHIHVARQAHHDFGKGRHPAGLNFGDCFAYPLARATGEPLLFKGGYFRKTDIVSALP